MHATIEANKQDMKANKQDFDEKMMNLTEDFKLMLASTITSIIYQNNVYKSSPSHKYSPKALDPNTVIQSDKRDPPF